MPCSLNWEHITILYDTSSLVGGKLSSKRLLEGDFSISGFTFNSRMSYETSKKQQPTGLTGTAYACNNDS